MALYKRFRKTVSKARKGIRKVAKAYLKARRSKIGKSYFKGGMVSSTAVAKSLSNLRAIRSDMAAGLEWKTLDQNHNTVGNPSNALRYFYRIQSSASLATESSTSAVGTFGYLVKQINLPSVGTGPSNYDGQKYKVKSIALKGGCALLATGDQTITNGTLKVMIVKYNDAVDSGFNISEFINTDTNGEYSTVGKRNRDHYKDYQVIATRKITLQYGQKTKGPIDIFVRPEQIHRHDDSSVNDMKVKYFVVMLASPDISTHVTSFDVNFSTRLRFIH